jgi:hypothetical protein
MGGWGAGGAGSKPTPSPQLLFIRKLGKWETSAALEKERETTR